MRRLPLNGNGYLSDALLCQAPYAVYCKALKVLRRLVRFQRSLITIDFPQREYVGVLAASSDVERTTPGSLRDASRSSRKIASTLSTSSGANV